jgi:hypothetical protein
MPPLRRYRRACSRCPKQEAALRRGLRPKGCPRPRRRFERAGGVSPGRRTVRAHLCADNPSVQVMRGRPGPPDRKRVTTLRTAAATPQGALSLFVASGACLPAVVVMPCSRAQQKAGGASGCIAARRRGPERCLDEPRPPKSSTQAIPSGSSIWSPGSLDPHPGPDPPQGRRSRPGRPEPEQIGGQGMSQQARPRTAHLSRHAAARCPRHSPRCYG